MRLDRRKEGPDMRRTLALLLVLAAFSVASADTVNVTNGASTDPMTYDPARYLVRTDDQNPSAQEVADFVAGQYDLLSFTTVTPVLTAADTDLDSCSLAVSTICTQLAVAAQACRVVPGLRCVGSCANGSIIKIEN